MSALKTILIVDDKEINRKILVKILSDEYETLQAKNGKEALMLLQQYEKKIAAVLLDLLMPVMDGFEFLKTVYEMEQYKNLPIIVSTGNDSKEHETKALYFGAWDFVSKPYDAQILKFRLKNAIERSQISAFYQLKYLAEYDSLTNIYNKTKFFSVTRDMLDRHPEKKFVFVRFDIDRFQLINTFYGEEEGDKLLRYIGQKLTKFLSYLKPCTYGRIESDVFGCCIFYTEKERVDKALSFAKKMIRLYHLSFDIVPTFGVYYLEDYGLPIHMILDRATLAAKAGKGNYMNSVSQYVPEMSQRIAQEQKIVNEMSMALSQGQFEVYLQPKYSLATNMPYGAEALIRWNHPEKGLIVPGVFIPVFEKNGFISKLDYYVWEQVCRFFRKWMEEDMPLYPISVNVSRVDLYDPQIIEKICGLVEKYGIPTYLFELEMTETAYMDNPTLMKQVLVKLREKGFTILMDDFGTGYSSLSILKDIEVDVLKIDTRFLEHSEDGKRGEHILASVVKMAKCLNIPTVAEGAESLEQVEFLRSIGCEYVQGYYFARPMSVYDYEQLKRETVSMMEMFQLNTNLDIPSTFFLEEHEPKSHISEELQEIADKKQMEMALNSITVSLWTYEIETGVYNGRNAGAKNIGFGGIIHGGYQGVLDGGYVLPDSIEEYKRIHQALEQGEKSASGTIHFNKTKVAIEWQKITYFTIFNEHGKPVMGVAVGEDVSELVNAQLGYAEELHNQEALQEKNLVGKIRANLTQNKVDYYVPYEEIFTINDILEYFDETIDQIASLCIEEENAKILKEIMGRESLMEQFALGKKEHSFEYRRRMRDGSIRWVENRVKVYSALDSKDVMCFMFALDVEEERTKQAIIDRLIAVDYELLGLISIEENTLHFVQQSFLEKREQMGIDVPYDENMEQFIENYVLEDSREQARTSMLISNVCSNLERAKAYQCAFTVDFQGKKYRKKWEFTYLDETRTSILYVRSDITELFQKQEEQREYLKNALLQAEQANEAKTEFLSRMSHEIRTPMNAIIGMAALAAQCVNDPNQVADCISKVGISARYLLSLINDILDMSRIESGKMIVKQETIPFEEFIGGINTIAYELADRKRIDYDCIMTSFVEDVYLGDPMKLQQVLINIISNAVKFTPEGGKVQFIINQNRVEKGRVNMRFTINDTGIGIREEFLSKLFIPFEQAHSGSTNPYGGTGLGLAICKNLVSMMKGTIAVNSIEGVGTEFTVDIPLCVSEEKKQISKLKYEISWEKLSVLIVDDEITICENTKRILSEMGTKAEWVDSGSKALERVKEKWSKKEYYDLILVDWKMPELDGIETARKIRKIVGSNVTIIIMTSYDWIAIETEAKKAGVNLLISKPLFKSSLCLVFEEIYQKREQESKPIEYDFTGKRVLLVEDHVLNIEVAKRLLSSKGFEVEVAENGLLAIETFTLSSEDYFDVILMDIRMPVMDGLTAAKAIRQLRKAKAGTIPIIAMSANAFEEDVDKSKAAGMNAHLAKPIEPQLLFSVLHSFLN